MYMQIKMFDGEPIALQISPLCTDKYILQVVNEIGKYLQRVTIVTRVNTFHWVNSRRRFLTLSTHICLSSIKASYR